MRTPLPVSASQDTRRNTWPRLGMGLVGVIWIALSSTLCGCGAGSAMVANQSGKSYFKRGQYTAAANYFSRATLDDPTNPTYAYNLAKALHKQGQTAPAERQYRRALAIDPRHQPTYNGLASLMNETGRATEANSLLTAWATTQPHLPAAHIELAALRREQGDFMGSEQSLRQALATDPGNTTALAHMGELKQQQGNLPEAARFYHQSLAKNPFQSKVSDRLVAVSQPPTQAVQQAAHAPAPQVIAGRTNPNYVPQMAATRPAWPWGAPPYTNYAASWSPHVQQSVGQFAGPQFGTPGHAGPAVMTSSPMIAGGGIRPAAYPAHVQQQITQQQIAAQQMFRTPGMPVQAGITPALPSTTTFTAPAATTVTYQMPTQPLPAPTLTAPTFPEPVLGQPVPLTPAAHHNATPGVIQQLNFTVPAF